MIKYILKYVNGLNSTSGLSRKDDVVYLWDPGFKHLCVQGVSVLSKG